MELGRGFGVSFWVSLGWKWGEYTLCVKDEVEQDICRLGRVYLSATSFGGAVAGNGTDVFFCENSEHRMAGLVGGSSVCGCGSHGVASAFQMKL